MGLRDIRFGISTGGAASRAEWQERARRVEALGYDILLTADHLVDDAFPPLLPLVSAADVTERLRVGTYVVNNDFRHPVLLAREAAALGLLTDGRFVLGLGAGHMRSEYDEAGIPFDGGAVRVDRLEESVAIVRGLLDGDEVTHSGEHYTVTGHTAWPTAPRVPLLIGGNGRRVLALAARSADAVGFAGFSHNRDATEVRLTHFTASGLDEQVAWVREQRRRPVRRPRAHRARADRAGHRRPAGRGHRDRRAPGAAHRRPGARLALPVPRHRPRRSSSRSAPPGSAGASRPGSASPSDPAPIRPSTPSPRSSRPCPTHPILACGSLRSERSARRNGIGGGSAGGQADEVVDAVAEDVEAGGPEVDRADVDAEAGGQLVGLAEPGGRQQVVVAEPEPVGVALELRRTGRCRTAARTCTASCSRRCSSAPSPPTCRGGGGRGRGRRGRPRAAPRSSAR